MISPVYYFEIVPAGGARAITVATYRVLTSEIRSFRKRPEKLGPTEYNLHGARLDEVHLSSYGSLGDDHVSRLEELVAQSRHHVAHEARVRVREKRHRTHRGPAVVLHHVLKPDQGENT